MTWVGDYSWSRPNLQAMKDAGCIGVVRYLGPGNGGRDITAAEVRRIHDAGLGLGLVWETTTTAALAGFKAGWHDFDQANHYADRIGWPSKHPVFYAVDTDTDVAQARGPVADTLHGALSVGGHPMRPYGEADILDVICGELSLAPCGWQCMAWSRGRLSRYRCMYQLYPPVMAGAVDKNELGPMPTDFLWHPDITFDAPLEHGDEVDMAFTRDEMKEDLAALAFDLADHLERARVSIIEADTQNAENVANVVRGESGTTRESLKAALDQMNDDGTLPEGVDAAALDALADALAPRLAGPAQS